MLTKSSVHSTPLSNAAHALSGPKAAVACIILGGVAAYANSLYGTFIFDDYAHIVHNPSIQTLWPPWQALAHSRPLINLTLAINYAISEFNTWSYHVFNILIHILSGITLFGVLRQTFLRSILCARWRDQATGLALASALLWTVHPLQTESVTYIIQRSESVTGLLFLLTLYSWIRGAYSCRYSRIWHITAIAIACAGAFGKETIITIPLIILLYDRIFLVRSFEELMKKRGWYYAGLAAVIVLMTPSVIDSFQKDSTTSTQAGFAYPITPLRYAATQTQAIAYYLRLAFWPAPLNIDYYSWPLATSFADVDIYAAVIVALIVLTASALFFNPALAFWGLWFFITLAPTSSFIPIADLIAERRMYLPLAAVTTLTVLGVRGLADWPAWRTWRNHRDSVLRGLFLIITVIFISMTSDRNRVYATPLTLWQDCVSKDPFNARALYYLGLNLWQQGRHDEASFFFRSSAQLNPNDAFTRVAEAYATAAAGHDSAALEAATKALELRPDATMGSLLLGQLLVKEGKFDEAIAVYKKALAQAQDKPSVLSPLIGALLKKGRLQKSPEALLEARETALNFVKIAPSNSYAVYIAGRIHSEFGEPEKAIELYREFLKEHPRDVNVRNALGMTLGDQGHFDAAAAELKAALDLDPRNAPILVNLGNVKRQLGQYDEAIQYFESALSVDPKSTATQKLLEQTKMELADPALRTPSNPTEEQSLSPEEHYRLGQEREALEDWASALKHYTLALQANFNNADYNTAIMRVLKKKKASSSV
ncbi:MAG: tetratricopeptide repeat protein [Candidatus Omnitrophica bacterium]|nr:tetratricopeptide repeat protein [Candidatus Omnitrophota bacterium]MDD5671509.1 tetratricopeptide repeat protein [Candidatus Omnitrophota bacterium]